MDIFQSFKSFSEGVKSLGGIALVLLAFIALGENELLCSVVIFALAGLVLILGENQGPASVLIVGIGIVFLSQEKVLYWLWTRMAVAIPFWISAIFASMGLLATFGERGKS